MSKFAAQMQMQFSVAVVANYRRFVECWHNIPERPLAQRLTPSSQRVLHEDSDPR